MQRIKPLLFSAVAIAIVALFAATGVWAQQCGPSENTADYECNDGVQDNYTVRILEPFPEIAFCTSYPGEKCSTYTWSISPTALSHFNLIVERLFLDKIVDSPGLSLDCTGRGDTSTGADDYAQFLTWNCFIKFSGTANPSVTLRGEFASAPTDWFVKQSNTSAEGDFGITRGPFPEYLDLSLRVTSSASTECKILGYHFDETNGIWIPTSMLIKREVDGCTVLSSNIHFFKNEPECQGDTTCTPGTAGCNLLQSVEASPNPDRNYCMALEGPECNDCVENESGSPQEYWYWNNGQLSYSCFDLANPAGGYACPVACYANAKCL